MSKKESLINALRGSIDACRRVLDLLSGQTIYDEDGYVDTAFLTEILVCIDEHTGVAAKMMDSILSMFGSDKGGAPASQNKQDDGAVLTPDAILSKCILEDNVIKLPSIRFSKKTYLEIKKIIENAGGSWVGGKTQGFMFDFDASRVFRLLQSGERPNLQQDYQFFETPPETADWLVTLAGAISDHERILEPSAGRGAIIKAILRRYPEATIDYLELMPENREILSKMDFTGNVTFVGDDFLSYATQSGYDKIIANPPFSENRDVKHLRKMYALLKPGGVIAAITSRHWMVAQETICEEFRKWMNEVGGTVYSIEAGAFKESNTSVSTACVVIVKTSREEVAPHES